MKKIVLHLLLLTLALPQFLSASSAVRIDSTECAVDWFYEVSLEGVYYFNADAFGEGDIVAYSWDFGDGSSSEDSTPEHEFTGSGETIVCLTILFSSGCTATSCSSILIEAEAGDCSVTFSYDIEGEFVAFNSTTMPGSGDILSYNWNFGDGETSDDANPTHNYEDYGEYEACLTIETYGGCVATYCHSIFIGEEDSAACDAYFEIESEGSEVYFFNASTTDGEDIISYSWSFGDGSFSDDENPMHDYLEFGLYEPCLTIVTSSGCTDTFCQELYLSGDSTELDCEAFYTVVSIEMGGDGWVVVFNNESIVDGDIEAVLWYFGDGSTATSYDAEHVYTEAGIYTVCIVVASADGTCIDEFCETIEIGEEDEESCSAAFEFVVDGTEVTFIETAESSGSEIITYLWTFDGGSALFGSEVTYSDVEMGVHEVCLTIITADSCVDTHCSTIVIGGGDSLDCTALFSVSSIEAFGDGWAVSFNNESVGASETVSWSFGDGTTTSTFDAEHYFATNGVYIICLTYGVEGTDCYATYCQEIVLIGEDSCILPSAIDSSVACIAAYIPVCGCDGITYGNECYAYYYAGIVYFTEGECPTDAVLNPSINNLDAFTLFPNPTNNQVVLSYSLLQKSQISVRIISLHGETIFEQFYPHQIAGISANQIDVSQLANGIYLVQIDAGGETATQKLMINN